METKYTNELNTLILVALLKKYNIKRVIVSPGATNVSFVASIQYDSFFEVYSAIDERSAAYMACGLADATNEPVVLSCTGATASRNYVPGLTEAYYRKLPILAITSSLNIDRVGFYVPQLIDRSQQPNDIVNFSVNIPTIDSSEKSVTEIKINRALLALEKGPVHINLVSNYSYDFSVSQLPEVRKIDVIKNSESLPKIIDGKIGVFIGAHKPFSQAETEAIDRFCKVNNAIVLCDQTSNYRGKYRILAPLINNQPKRTETYYFDLIIHIGYVSGAYISFLAKEVWRVNEDGELRDLYGSLSKVFATSEKDFFEWYSDGLEKDDTLIKTCKSNYRKLVDKIDDDLPFSNIWIALKTEHLLPANSVLHLGILNSLRAWNFFETPNTVTAYSNTGGFGIDGCLSSAIGAAIAAPEKEVYIVLGDLAFFYDCNCIVNNLPQNIHILVVNNGVGCEFKNYNHRVAMFGEKADEYMAARGHNGKQSTSLIRDIASSNGLEYYSASNKDEFLQIQKQWIKSKKTILEVFTSDKDESKALRCINSLEVYVKYRIKRLIKDLLGR